jgi:hypothetical protein
MLRAAGLITEDLHEDYYPVFEKLTNQELAVLMLVKARLDGVKSRGAPDYMAGVPL